jgi:hypothetical protein
MEKGLKVNEGFWGIIFNPSHSVDITVSKRS